MRIDNFTAKKVNKCVLLHKNLPKSLQFVGIYSIINDSIFPFVQSIRVDIFMYAKNRAVLTRDVLPRVLLPLKERNFDYVKAWQKVNSYYLRDDSCDVIYCYAGDSADGSFKHK